MTDTPLKSSAVLATFRAFVLALWLAIIVIPSSIAWLFGAYKLRAALVHIFFAFACATVGVRVRLVGEMAKARPMLVVTNHCSYLDIFVVASQVPVSFTPKREIASWPVIGFLCRLSDCVFVERRPGKIREAQAEMDDRLQRGKVLCIFPEGTTNEGAMIKPFKSGFFKLAEASATRPAMPVQPATVIYTRLNGELIRHQLQRDCIAWYGDMTFFDHFWKLMGMHGVEAEVHAGPVLMPSDAHDRKAVCQQAEEIIGTTLATRQKALQAGAV